MNVIIPYPHFNKPAPLHLLFPGSGTSLSVRNRKELYDSGLDKASGEFIEIDRLLNLALAARVDLEYVSNLLSPVATFYTRREFFDAIQAYPHTKERLINDDSKGD